MIVYLQNQESVVVQVDALISECLGDLFVLDSPVLEGVEGAVVLVCRPRHGELGVGDDLKLLPALVEDLLEVDSHLAAAHVAVGAGVVNEDGQLLGPEHQELKEECDQS